MVEAEGRGPRFPRDEVVTYTHGETARFSILLRDETGMVWFKANPPAYETWMTLVAGTPLTLSVSTEMVEGKHR